MRKYPLVNNHVYHAVTRSIAKYKVFNDPQDFARMVDILRLYRYRDFTTKYSMFSRQPEKIQKATRSSLSGSPKSVEIIAYCIMPTHLHLEIKQLTDKGISRYIAKVLNSYTRYFNCVHKRKGPLWEGKFRNILVNDNDQLLHLTRYIHLNPTSADIAKDPSDWPHSSYEEYISDNVTSQICKFSNIIDMSKKDYKRLTEDHKSYQRDLSIIKYLTIDSYSG